MSLHSRVEEIWWRSSPPPALLRLIEPLYAAVSSRHLERRAANPVRPPLPLISVGNITAGGSGKTPFVIWLAAALQQHGFRPVILCRGDGGRSSAPLPVTAASDPDMAGDEACLLAGATGCPVIAAKDRVAGCRLAAGHGDVLILDDGFQYRQLQRCCDIVLLPAEGIGNGHMIPAGPLREPPAALERADIIVRTGQHAACEAFTSAREWRWSAGPAEMTDIMQTGAARPAGVLAAAAIARPQRFFADLESFGLELGGSRTYPDHYRYRRRDVDELCAAGLPVVVTAKDAVKLAPLWPRQLPLWVLTQKGEGEPGLVGSILQRLQEDIQHPS